MMVIYLSWYLHFFKQDSFYICIYKVLTFNHLAFGDKSVRVLGLHI